MKLKEVPVFFVHALRLKRAKRHRLLQKNNATLGNCIISLTSIEARLKSLHLVIRSLVLQSTPAEKVVLWLHISLKDRLPSSLTSLVGDNFEIRYSTEHCPHRKLVEPLRTKDFSGKRIVTCDDDMMYPKDWLARLIKTHERYPTEIVAHECRKILKGSNGEVEPYAKWVKEEPGQSHPDTISVGYGGVLYPPGCLPRSALDSELYMHSTPRADDLWFKANSVLQGTAIRRSFSCEPMPIPILGSQKVALKRANIKEDENRAQWLAVSTALNIKI